MFESFGSPIVVIGPRRDRPRQGDPGRGPFWSEPAHPPSLRAAERAPTTANRQIMEALKIGQTAMVVGTTTASFTEIAAALRPGSPSFMTAAMPRAPAEADPGASSYLFNGIIGPRRTPRRPWAWITFWADAEPAVASLEATATSPPRRVTAGGPAPIAGKPASTAAAGRDHARRPPCQPAFVRFRRLGRQRRAVPQFQKVLVGNATAGGRRRRDDPRPGAGAALGVTAQAGSVCPGSFDPPQLARGYSG
jgi:hypothetical protein